MKTNLLKFALTALLLAALVGVRALELQLFYDPFITHFKRADYLAFVPEVDAQKMYFYLIIRYLINSTLSIALLFVWFSNKSKLLFWIFVYVLAGLITGMLFVVSIRFLPDFYTAFFYIRRLLIQPIWLLLLFPAAAIEVQKTNKL
ncbi:MAG: exosortase F system-associated protein [Flavobacteriaceae bacterium]|nr:exosortase F system-associated protein [Flavobacteriaceae bacterium]